MATEAVVDSSVIIAVVTLEEYTVWARKILSEYTFFHILDLNYYEVANALKCKRSTRFSTEQAENAFAQAIKLMDIFGVHSFGEVIADAMNLALELNIAVYDAAFVVLADKLDMRLLTLDLKLAKKLEPTKYYGLIKAPTSSSR